MKFERKYYNARNLGSVLFVEIKYAPNRYYLHYVSGITPNIRISYKNTHKSIPSDFINAYGRTEDPIDIFLLVLEVK